MFAVELNPRTSEISLADESLVAVTAGGLPRKDRKAYFSMDAERLVLRMEGQAHPRYFARPIHQSILSASLHEPYYPHVAAVREELRSIEVLHLEPRERMRTPSALKAAGRIASSGEDLASFLYIQQQNHRAAFDNIRRNLSLIIPSISSIQLELNSLGEVELFIHEHGTKLSARVVSEGTLRLLGVIALAHYPQPPSIVIIEEPENGVTPERLDIIERILRSLTEQGTQVIITTHSEAVYQLVPRSSLLRVAKHGLSTTITRIDPTSLYDQPGGVLVDQSNR